jgi:adenosylcobyric acid synthase
LLDLDIEFANPKVLRRTTATAQAIPAGGYEIHHGRVTRSGDPAWLTLSDGRPEGSVREAIWGTHLHGLMESDELRRAWLAVVAERAGRSGFVVATGASVAAIRAAQLDLLADLVEQHLDLDRLRRLIGHGPTPALPAVRSELDRFHRE